MFRLSFFRTHPVTTLGIGVGVAVAAIGVGKYGRSKSALSRLTSSLTGPGSIPASVHSLKPQIRVYDKSESALSLAGRWVKISSLGGIGPCDPSQHEDATSYPLSEVFDDIARRKAQVKHLNDGAIDFHYRYWAEREKTDKVFPWDYEKKRYLIQKIQVQYAKGEDEKKKEVEVLDWFNHDVDQKTLDVEVVRLNMWVNGELKGDEAAQVLFERQKVFVPTSHWPSYRPVNMMATMANPKIFQTVVAGSHAAEHWSVASTEAKIAIDEKTGKVIDATLMKSAAKHMKAGQELTQVAHDILVPELEKIMAQTDQKAQKDQ
jgi:hypothetical protein